ncbi:MAG: hypothetical protein O2834_06870, partial [Crenarchaeota archaeon]|nr:hypothetical protein [Thermoproteota archaeon]
NKKISNELERLEKSVKMLEIISKKHNEIIQNQDKFDKVYSLIKEMRNQIVTGENLINNIIELRVLIDSIKNDIRESVAEKQSNNLKRFFEKLIDKIDQKVMEAKVLGMDEIEITKANDLIFEIRELLSQNEITKAKTVYSELKIVLQNIGISVKIT